MTHRPALPADTTLLRRPKTARFTIEEAMRATDEWGCNCGPAAIAGICNLTLDQVRPHMGGFETKRYTNPTMMFNALSSLGVGWSLTTDQPNWPCYGLARIQWEGPWTKPGVPMRARYRHTHWVGACQLAPDNIGIFDINCIANGSGWTDLKSWSDNLVPWLLEEIAPKADGKWHITHAIEVRP